MDSNRLTLPPQFTAAQTPIGFIRAIRKGLFDYENARGFGTLDGLLPRNPAISIKLGWPGHSRMLWQAVQALAGLDEAGGTALHEVDVFDNTAARIGHRMQGAVLILTPLNDLLNGRR